MPIELIGLSAAIAIIAIGVLYLRVPTYALLFSLLVGQVLSAQASQDVYSFMASVTGFATYQYIQLTLLLLPVILTTVFLRGKAVKGRMVYEFIPAIFVGISLIMLMYPYVPFIKNTLDDVTNGQIEVYKSFSLIVASVLGLVSVWISYPKGGGKEKHHKH